MFISRLKLLKEKGALHIFALLSMALFIIGLLVVYQHWQTVRRLDGQVKQLSSKIETLETKIKVLELRAGL